MLYPLREKITVHGGAERNSVIEIFEPVVRNTKTAVFILFPIFADHRTVRYSR